MMEPDFGRARVMAQKVDNDEALQESIDCCPVDCIHWVSLYATVLLSTCTDADLPTAAAAYNVYSKISCLLYNIVAVNA